MFLMNGGQRMYLVTYDIEEDKLRRKIATKLESYGKRVQYSVFECKLEPKKYKKMYAELIKLTEDKEGVNIRIYFFDMHTEDKTVTIGDPSYVSETMKEDVLFI